MWWFLPLRNMKNWSFLRLHLNLGPNLKKKTLDLYRTFAVLVLFKMLGINTKKTRHLFFHVCFFFRLFCFFICSKDQQTWWFNLLEVWGLENDGRSIHIPTGESRPTEPRLLRDLASAWFSTLTSTKDFLGDENVKSASVKTHKKRGGPKRGAEKKTPGEHRKRVDLSEIDKERGYIFFGKKKNEINLK